MDENGDYILKSRVFLLYATPAFSYSVIQLFKFQNDSKSKIFSIFHILNLLTTIITFNIIDNFKDILLNDRYYYLLYPLTTIFTLIYAIFVEREKETIFTTKFFQFKTHRQKMIKILHKIETIIVVFFCTIGITFLRTVYSSAGIVFDTELIMILNQARIYKKHYSMIFSFFHDNFFICFLPSISNLIAFLRNENYQFRILKTKYRFKFKIRYLSIFYIISFFNILNQLIKPVSVSNSGFLDSNYVFAYPDMLTFPEKKKNIIYFSLESIENSFLSKTNGGMFDESYIPKLENMSFHPDNVHFSHLKNKLGGVYQLPRDKFTMVSNFAMMCSTEFLGNNGGIKDQDLWMKKINCMGDLLKNSGYSTNALFSTPYHEWDIGILFAQHGFQNIMSGETLHSNVIWTEDHILYNHAKHVLRKLGDSPTPFILYIMTLDTHEPGTQCRLCPNKKNKVEAVFNCFDNQITDLIKWVKNKSWGKDTVIAMVGDHISRYHGLGSRAKQENFARRDFNLFINPFAKASWTNERVFTHLDVMPTVLSAAGIEIKGNRLGLGTNLFSGKPTLAETYGVKKLESECENTMKFYKGTYYNQSSNDCVDNEPCLTISIKEQA